MCSRIKGQGSVKDFQVKLALAEKALAPLNLVVYVGYHADPNGQWCVDFDTQEKKDVTDMAKRFPKAQLEWLAKSSTLLTDDEIKKGVNK